MRLRYSKTHLMLIGLYLLLTIIFSFLEELLYLLFVVIIPCVVIGYLVWNHLRWKNIERLNESYNITRYNAYIDSNGYLRWKDSNRLCHRDIAWDANLRGPGKFGELDIHHKDGNKFNNSPANLEVLTREAHQREHDQILTIDGQTYHTWIPKSQVVIHEGFLYILALLYEKKGFISIIYK